MIHLELNVELLRYSQLTNELLRLAYITEFERSPDGDQDLINYMNEKVEANELLDIFGAEFLDAKNRIDSGTDKRNFDYDNK